MCNGIHLKFNDKDLCIPIYYLQLQWPPNPNPPDPGPMRQVFGDISTLATINQAIGHVQNEGVRNQLAHALKAAVTTVAKELPQGMTIGDQLFAAPKGAKFAPSEDGGGAWSG
jgi:hypothetical protein